MPTDGGAVTTTCHSRRAWRIQMCAHRIQRSAVDACLPGTRTGLGPPDVCNRVGTRSLARSLSLAAP